VTTSCVLALLLLQADSGGGGLKEVVDKVGLRMFQQLTLCRARLMVCARGYPPQGRVHLTGC
jgi:hypothetical protein